MNIAFVQANTSRQNVVRGGIPSTAIMQFVAMLKARGVKTLYVDALLENLKDQQAVSRLEEFEPHVIGIACLSDNRFAAMETIRCLRGAFPDTLLMGGGHQFSHQSEDALRVVPELDLIVRHEADETITRLLDTGFERDHFEEISGITFRTPDGEIISTSDAPPPPDLDRFPVPDWTAAPSEHISSFGVSASRGCVGKCTFCAAVGTRLRFRSPDRVLEEIQILVDLFGRERLDGKLSFNDDSLTLNRKNFYALMDGMIDTGFNLRWIARSRADALDEDMIRAMKEAGCISISSGIDAPSQRIMDTMGKREKMEDIVRAFETCSRLKMNCGGTVLIGYEGETVEDIENGAGIMKRLNRLPHITVNMGMLYIYPGTKLEQIGRRNGSLPPDFSWYRQEHMARVERDTSILWQDIPYFIPSTMPCSELKRLCFRYGKMNMDYLRRMTKWVIKKKQYHLFLKGKTYRVLGSRLLNLAKI